MLFSFLFFLRQTPNGLRYPRWAGGGTPSDWKKAEA
jgi:hypothetical protein